VLVTLATTPSGGGKALLGAERDKPGVVLIVTPSVAGCQLVRTSVGFLPGMVTQNQEIVARCEQSETLVSFRPLTWHPRRDDMPRSVRRAMVTFPYRFRNKAPARFTLRARPSQPRPQVPWPVEIDSNGETVEVRYGSGPTLKARLLTPKRASTDPPRIQPVELTPHYRWQRAHLSDPQWPRVIETRVDATGCVVVVGHLQRNLQGNGRAPDFGWEITIDESHGGLCANDKVTRLDKEAVSHGFALGKPCYFDISTNRSHRISHPAAHHKRRGRVKVRRNQRGGITYRYWRCSADEKVPMQQATWRRTAFVVAPQTLAPLTPTLQSPHHVRLDPEPWQALYAVGEPPDLSDHPKLAELVRYHRQAIVCSVARGDDWGNVTSYADGRDTGAIFGMNRLNHCPAIFFDGLCSGDQRLLHTIVAWCDNFHDLTIWWGPKQTGGTRYNNLIAMGRTPPDEDRSFMWRSNSSVHFCTKGYDTFLLTYEQTGDPRMLAAFEAQIAYAAEHVHADRGECRNIGDVADFVRLYEWTGERRYLDEGLRLFRELRTKLSAGDLFSQSGRPIVSDPPFIDEDKTGYKHPFAKPYIIGYALAGLPALVRHVPNEPRLRDVVRAVADFLSDSQDPVGGWRYPHPRSTHVILSQAMEHAWQLVQADKLLGPQDRHLDAIERVIRQRLHGWLKTGKIFASIAGWELATGKARTRKDIYALYKRPADRDFRRDYVEGVPSFGSAPPEGLVYFTEVLAYYLKHRPVERLLAPPRADEPLGQVVGRVPGESP